MIDRAYHDLLGGFDLNTKPLVSDLAGRTVLQVDPTASAYQAVLRHVGECGEAAKLDRCQRLCARRHHQKAPQPPGLTLHVATDSFGHSVRNNACPAGFSRQPRYIGERHGL